jgi:glycosyltransferase involved in cell wall biosynthesis
MKSPKFSVVVTLYNKAAEIPRALRSVLSQTVQDFEILIINDGSTDGSRAAVEAFVDPRIRIIDQLNGGESAARNRGIAEASSALIAFLDGDDEWMPSFLTTISRLLMSFPEAGAFAVNYIAKTRSGTPLSVPKRCVPRHPWEGVIPNYFQTRSVLHPSSIVVRKDVFSAAGQFRVGLNPGADLEMWFRIGARYPIAYSTHPGAVVYGTTPCRTRNPIKPPSESFLDRSLAEIEAATEIPPTVKSQARDYVAAVDLRRILMLIRVDSQFDASRALSRWRQHHGITARWLLCKIASLLPEGIFDVLLTLRSFGVRSLFRRDSKTPIDQRETS